MEPEWNDRKIVEEWSSFVLNLQWPVSSPFWESSSTKERNRALGWLCCSSNGNYSSVSCLCLFHDCARAHSQAWYKTSYTFSPLGGNTLLHCYERSDFPIWRRVKSCSWGLVPSSGISKAHVCFFLPCVREEYGQLRQWHLLNVMINTFKSSSTNDYGFHTFTNCFNFWLKWKSTCFSIVGQQVLECITNILKVSLCTLLFYFGLCSPKN